jgi:hypothetical protein
MQQYTQNINLPYNASYSTNESCEIQQDPEETLVDAISTVVLKQNTCAFGSCVTTFQFTTKIFAFLVLDKNCHVSELTIETEPNNGWAYEQIQANQGKYIARIEQEIANNPEFQQYCLR